MGESAGRSFEALSPFADSITVPRLFITIIPGFLEFLVVLPHLFLDFGPGVEVNLVATGCHLGSPSDLKSNVI